jgi:hypothetical protein
MDELHEANHHLGNMAELAVGFLHVKALAKREVPQDIEDQVRDLVFHIHGLCQFLPSFFCCPSKSSHRSTFF